MKHCVIHNCRFNFSDYVIKQCTLVCKHRKKPKFARYMDMSMDQSINNTKSLIRCVLYHKQNSPNEN